MHPYPKTLQNSSLFGSLLGFPENGLGCLVCHLLLILPFWLHFFFQINLSLCLPLEYVLFFFFLNLFTVTLG